MYNVHIEVESLVYIYMCICRFKNDLFPCGDNGGMFSVLEIKILKYGVKTPLK